MQITHGKIKFIFLRCVHISVFMLIFYYVNSVTLPLFMYAFGKNKKKIRISWLSQLDLIRRSQCITLNLAHKSAGQRGTVVTWRTTTQISGKSWNLITR